MRYMGLPNVSACKCLEHNPSLSAFKSESKVSPSQPVLFQGPSGGEEGDGSTPVDIPAASSGSVPARWPAHFSGIAFICLPAEPRCFCSRGPGCTLGMCLWPQVSPVSEFPVTLTYKIACKVAALAVPASQGGVNVDLGRAASHIPDWLSGCRRPSRGALPSPEGAGQSLLVD